jgi:hypothetical protein
MTNRKPQGDGMKFLRSMRFILRWLGRIPFHGRFQIMERRVGNPKAGTNNSFDMPLVADCIQGREGEGIHSGSRIPSFNNNVTNDSLDWRRFEDGNLLVGETNAFAARAFLTHGRSFLVGKVVP